MEQAMTADSQFDRALNGDQGKILIVEDDDVLLTVAVEMFRGMGYDPVTASDALQALETLKNDPEIDYLFTDVVMPHGMNGVDLAREARAFSPDLKVLLASGYPLEKFTSDGENMDDAAFINKPYRTAELIEKMDSLK